MDYRTMTVAEFMEWIAGWKWLMSLSPAKQEQLCRKMEQQGVNHEAVAILREACKKGRKETPPAETDGSRWQGAQG